MLSGRPSTGDRSKPTMGDPLLRLVRSMNGNSKLRKNTRSTEQRYLRTDQEK